jgi:hypothetical protein
MCVLVFHRPLLKSLHTLLLLLLLRRESASLLGAGSGRRLGW